MHAGAICTSREQFCCVSQGQSHRGATGVRQGHLLCSYSCSGVCEKLCRGTTGAGRGKYQCSGGMRGVTQGCGRVKRGALIMQLRLLRIICEITQGMSQVDRGAHYAITMAEGYVRNMQG